MFRGICDYRRHSITHGTQSLPSGQEGRRRKGVDPFFHSIIKIKSHTLRIFVASLPRRISLFPRRDDGSSAASVWVFWVGFTCLLARHEPTTTALPLSIPIAEHHTHTLAFPQNFSRIETELCANEIIVMIPLDVTELDTSSSEGIRGESRSLLANYTRRSLSLHHFPRRGPYHLLLDESDFHFFHSKEPCTHFAQTPSSQLQLCESCCKYACCCWLLSKV